MAITVTVKGKHLQVTDGLRQYAEQRLEKLDKYLANVREAIVVESVEGNEHRVEIMLQGDGVLLRGEERTSNMYASLDKVVDKLEQRIKKLKSKKIAHLRNSETLRVNVAPNNAALTPGDGVLPAQTDDDTDEEERPQIVRTKAVTMKPMSVDDACRMLELIDHPWYVYLDMDTNLTQVVYRRRDGHYGLVVPKI
jgi:putative sigma-54 modulation protein